VQPISQCRTHLIEMTGKEMVGFRNQNQALGIRRTGKHFLQLGGRGKLIEAAAEKKFGLFAFPQEFVRALAAICIDGKADGR